MQHSFIFSGGAALLLCFLIVTSASAEIFAMPRVVEPSGFYSFNEGSGVRVFDASGNGNFGTVYNNVSRIDNDNCGKAVGFDGADSYIAISSNTRNHPRSQVTAEIRFLLNDWTDGPIVSTLNNGGYRLGFGDGNDLWWTVNIRGIGDVSVPVRHEDISLNEWHLAAGTYDGSVLKLFLDGKMYASKGARGSINYTYENAVIVGAEAGTGDSPAPNTAYFRGALDELRIYTAALTNGEVIDDMVTTCSPSAGPIHLNLIPLETGAGPAIPAGSISLSLGENRTEVMRFDSASAPASWHVTVPPGSLLRVSMKSIPATYPDTWQIEITDGSSRLGLATWTIGQQGAPAEAVIPHGTSDVVIRYLSGTDRFPAHASVRFEALQAPYAAPTGTPAAPSWNVAVVIYSVTGVAIIALVIAVVWLHLKKKEGEET